MFALDPDRGKETIEKKTSKRIKEVKNKGDEGELNKDIKNMFKYEQITKCLKKK